MVRLANLNCDESDDPIASVQNAIKDAFESKLQKRGSRARMRTSFPRPIEEAVEEQLYSRRFYKQNVLFEITVSEYEPGKLLFTTSLSYDVVNTRSDNEYWRAEYNYDDRNGRVLKASVKGEDYDPELLDFKAGRGISIRCELAPQEPCPVYFSVEEIFADEGHNLFTSYNPATDLKVLLKSGLPHIHFDFEVLYTGKRHKPEEAMRWKSKSREGSCLTKALNSIGNVRRKYDESKPSAQRSNRHGKKTRQGVE